jgi:hypothetical protein
MLALVVQQSRSIKNAKLRFSKDENFLSTYAQRRWNCEAGPSGVVQYSSIPRVPRSKTTVIGSRKPSRTRGWNISPGTVCGTHSPAG